MPLAVPGNEVPVTGRNDHGHFGTTTPEQTEGNWPQMGPFVGDPLLMRSQGDGGLGGEVMGSQSDDGLGWERGW